MDALTLPRTGIDLWLRAVRLPLTGVEAVVHRDGDAQWPPSVAFEGFEAAVREHAGRFLRDERLLQQAQLQRAEVAQRRRALEHQEEAVRTAEAADERFSNEKQAAEEQRQRAEREAAQRKARLERERQETERKAAEQLAAKEAAQREAAEKRDRAVRSTERAAKVKRLDVEDKVLTKEEQVVEARAEARRLKQQAAATKARRQARTTG
jgi:colicin import membrane protein